MEGGRGEFWTLPPFLADIIGEPPLMNVPPRYWGSYSAVYPAGGGGNSGALALDLAARQEGWALASRAPTSRALASRPQKPRAPSPRVQETRCS